MNQPSAHHYHLPPASSVTKEFKRSHRVALVGTLAAALLVVVSAFGLISWQSRTDQPSTEVSRTYYQPL